MQRLTLIYTFFLIFGKLNSTTCRDSEESEQCVFQTESACNDFETEVLPDENYNQDFNEWIAAIYNASKEYTPCAEVGDEKCRCHSKVMIEDLTPFKEERITVEHLDRVKQYGVHYQIYDHKLYRHKDCLFPSRCNGVEHYLYKYVDKLPNMDLIINVRDYPQLPKNYPMKAPIFSFSKTENYQDITYPAWSFWEGGPAIGLYPTGIGRWDIMRDRIPKATQLWPWDTKIEKGFFRGSRTSEERDTLILLSRRAPDIADAKYTKNQAWKSQRDTLNAEPAAEVSFENHCKYKYLFNFRGVAASFRFKHLFLCKSLVFHVGNEWNEFFYPAMKPWVHYVPIKSYPKERELRDIITFFRENDDLAKSIAEKGFQFIWEHLRMEDVECYWDKLLTRYGKLLNYTVTRDDELILLNPKIKYY